MDLSFLIVGLMLLPSGLFLIFTKLAAVMSTMGPFVKIFLGICLAVVGILLIVLSRLQYLENMEWQKRIAQDPTTD